MRSADSHQICAFALRPALVWPGSRAASGSIVPLQVATALRGAGKETWETGFGPLTSGVTKADIVPKVVYVRQYQHFGPYKPEKWRKTLVSGPESRQADPHGGCGGHD